jgi:hypothetical protein
VAGHVLHLAVESGEQPITKVRLVARQIDIRDTQSRKAEFGAPAFDLPNQSGCVDQDGWADGIVTLQKAAIMLDNAANRCMNNAACPNLP